MDSCIEYWKANISEMSDPVARKRDVCCEPSCNVPICTCTWCYENVTNFVRDNPFDEDDPECTEEWMEVYTQHVELREKQRQNYKTFTGPVRKSTICKAAGCRRVFGRRGLIFCTEGCCQEQKRKADPAPPFQYRDIDDENDASVILQKVLGDPPKNVRYRRLHPIDEENQLELTEETPHENQKYK